MSRSLVRHPVFLWLSVGFMVGLGGLGLRNLLRPPGSPPPPPVRSPEPLDTLIEVGVLEPRVIERIATPINGTLTVAIEDGARVEKGGLLFLLDEEEIRSRIEQQQESIEQKLEEIEIARGDLEEVVNTYASVHRLELAELQHAELELAERERGLLPEERRLLEISIELAELDLEDRRARLERQRELVRQNFAAPTSLDVHLRETEAAEALLRERRTQLELQTQPLPEEERLTLQSAVDQARDIVERSQRRHDRELARRRLEIEGHEIQLRHQRRDLEDREWELDQVRVISRPTGSCASCGASTGGAAPGKPSRWANRSGDATSSANSWIPTTSSSVSSSMKATFSACARDSPPPPASPPTPNTRCVDASPPSPNWAKTEWISLPCTANPPPPARRSSSRKSTLNPTTFPPCRA